MSYEISHGWSVMDYIPLVTIDEKVLFLRAINSLPPDIKRFEIWPRIVGPCTPIASSAPRKPTVSSKIIQSLTLKGKKLNFGD